eukprot:IDg5449t1
MLAASATATIHLPSSLKCFTGYFEYCELAVTLLRLSSTEVSLQYLAGSYLLPLQGSSVFCCTGNRLPILNCISFCFISHAIV